MLLKITWSNIYTSLAIKQIHKQKQLCVLLLKKKNNFILIADIWSSYSEISHWLTLSNSRYVQMFKFQVHQHLVTVQCMGHNGPKYPFSVFIPWYFWSYKLNFLLKVMLVVQLVSAEQLNSCFYTWHLYSMSSGCIQGIITCREQIDTYA